jgi:cell division protein FtsW (lipid II flippase)
MKAMLVLAVVLLLPFCECR